MLDTDQLRSFIAIVDTGSFTRAALQVNKTQSAVSMHVRRLEERLGCTLFVKQGRGARLSDEGEKLVGFARRILQTETGAIAALSRKSLSGRVRFGIPDDYAEFYLARILTQFVARHPAVETSVICEQSIDLARLMATGTLDIALVTRFDGLRDFEPVREFPLVWVASPQFHLEPGDPVPVALGSPGCGWRRHTEDRLAASACRWRTALVSNNYSAIAPMVRARLAVTVHPADCVPPDLRALGPDSGLPELGMSTIGLIRAPGNFSPAADALADCIREAVGEVRRAA
ncbi:MAG: LysR family transcriptional regulator [Hyphomicrobiales bacterium]|nr:LysR family transcriptional regulator [Hyphomicrobiales bacterium]MDE2018097.1 LysR family transcriptional regulator [Hyphomicrobiales bacterium]